MKHKIYLLMNVVVFFLLAAVLTAQVQNRETINRDIKTMEKILDKLLHKESVPRHFKPHNTKGVYIPEYGLIFHIQQNPFERLRVKILNNRLEHMQFLKKSDFDTMDSNYKNSLEKIKEKQEKITQAVIKPDLKEKDIYIVDAEISEESGKTRQEIIQNIKDDIFLFYSKYASSLRNLEPGNKIAIIIDMDDWDESENDNSFLSSHIDFQSLEKYRKQKINKEQLKEHITYTVSRPQKDINTNIDIMNEIINQNLNNSQISHRPLYNNGFYFTDFGIIFFLEMPDHLYGRYYFRNFTRKYKNIDPDTNVEDAEKIDPQRKIAQLKDTIFDILASYGHTLQIHPEEYIIMNIDLGDKLFDMSTEQPRGLTMKIRKKFLDEYYHGELAKNNLQKKFTVNSYFP